VEAILLSMAYCVMGDLDWCGERCGLKGADGRGEGGRFGVLRLAALAQHDGKYKGKAMRWL
jgi:hypothetical protein